MTNPRRILIAGSIIFLVGFFLPEIQAAPAMGPSHVLNMLTTWVALPCTVSFTGWEVYTASSDIPTAATGVILRVHMGDTQNVPYGVRKYGSSDTITGYLGTNTGFTTEVIMFVGVDSNKRFEVYYSSGSPCHTAAPYFIIIGYTGVQTTFLTNACDISGSSATFENKSVTPCLIEPTDTPVAAILWVDNGNAAAQEDYYARVPAGTDDCAVGETCAFDYSILQSFVQKLVGNQFEQKRESANVKTYLIGYIDDDANLYTPINICSAVNCIGNKDVSAYIGDSRYILVWNRVITANQDTAQVRQNASAGSVGEYLSGETWLIVEVMSNGTFYQNTQDVHMYLYADIPDYVPGGTTTTTTTLVSAFDLCGAREGVADALSIEDEAGGILLSFLVFFLVLAPLSMITKNSIVLLIVGLSLSGFLVAVCWLPVWIMIMLCLIVALMLGSRLTSLASRGGSDEGD